MLSRTYLITVANAEAQETFSELAHWFHRNIITGTRCALNKKVKLSRAANSHEEVVTLSVNVTQVRSGQETFSATMASRAQEKPAAS